MKEGRLKTYLFLCPYMTKQYDAIIGAIGRLNVAGNSMVSKLYYSVLNRLKIGLKWYWIQCSMYILYLILNFGYTV